MFIVIYLIHAVLEHKNYVFSAVGQSANNLQESVCRVLTFPMINKIIYLPHMENTDIVVGI